MRKPIILTMTLLVICGQAVAASGEGEKTLPDFDKLWDYANPEQTEKKFRGLLPAAEKSEDRSYHGQLLTQIARTQGLQSRFEEAHKTLDAVEGLLTDDTSVARIRCLLERGRVFNSSKKAEKARPLFLKAWEIAVPAGEDFYAIDAAHMMQIVEPPEKQLEWAEKAIALAEKSGDQRAKGWLGALYNNTGWTYHDLKQYDRALELFEKGLKWREENVDEKGARIAKWTVARTYRSLGRIDEAIAIHRKLEHEFAEKGLERDGYVFEELGECYLLKGKKEEARKYFGLAYDLLSKDPWLAANEPNRLERMKKLGTAE